MDPKEELEYADEIPDEEEEDNSYEPTYRDGSALQTGTSTERVVATVFACTYA